MVDSAEMVGNPINPIPSTLQGADKFDFENVSKWPIYLAYFKKNLEGNGMNSLPEKTRVDALMLHLGLKGFEILYNSPLSETDKEKWDLVIDYFNQYFNPIMENVCQSRIKFNSRLQKEDEPTAIFVKDSFKLAKSCEFGQYRNDLIRDRILAGLLDREFSLSLAKNAELTLEETILELGSYEKKQGNPWDDNQIQKLIENSPERALSRSSCAMVDKKGSFPLLVENERKEPLRNIQSELRSERRFWHRSSKIPRNLKRQYFFKNLTGRKINRRRRGRQNRRFQNFRRNLTNLEMLKETQSQADSGNNFDDRSRHSSRLSPDRNQGSVKSEV